MIEWKRPAALTSNLVENPVVALAAPRPDFDGALQEFLIGLLAVALRPAGESDWKRYWETPPTEEELQAALDPLASAFYLQGDGPRFLQDLTAADFAEVEPTPIEQILIDAPGDQTRRLNKDLFVKRGRIERLGRPAAAMALLTLQTYAPSGGQGHRTSMRGGGPLTTLVDPRTAAAGVPPHDQPLWRKLWANVETEEQLLQRGIPGSDVTAQSAFPWLSPTRVSEKGSRPTTPGDVHPLQAYFGMPRRIRLDFDGPGVCDLTGQFDDSTVTGFRMRNYGVDYEGWHHPLSPHYCKKAGDTEWYPVHGQPEGVGWRDWVSLTMSSPEGGTRRPAQAVSFFIARRKRVTTGTRLLRLHAFGYDMDNMKARGWTEAMLPLFAADDPERQRLLYSRAAGMTEAASLTSSSLLFAVKRGLFQSAGDAPGDLGQVKRELWDGMSAPFFEALEAIAAANGPDEAEKVASGRSRLFLAAMTDVATQVFDRWCTAEGLTTGGLRRRVTARRDLMGILRGYTPSGQKIHAVLGLAPPEGSGAKKRASKRKEKAK